MADTLFPNSDIIYSNMISMFISKGTYGCAFSPSISPVHSEMVYIDEGEKGKIDEILSTSGEIGKIYLPRPPSDSIGLIPNAGILHIL